MGRPSQRLPERVYEAVMEQIRTGELRGGDRLIESDIAQAHGVSRTPVRTALQRLVLNGHATNADGGIIVAQPSEDEIFDAFVLRETLEGLASHLAAQRSTDLHAARLSALHSQFTEASARGDVHLAVQLTVDFHEYIWQISGSVVLGRIMHDLIDTYWSRVTPSSLPLEGRLEACEQEHAAILSAIIAGNSEQAEKHARQHIRDARNARIAADLNAVDAGRHPAL